MVTRKKNPDTNTIKLFYELINKLLYCKREYEFHLCIFFKLK